MSEGSCQEGNERCIYIIFIGLHVIQTEHLNQYATPPPPPTNKVSR